MYRWQGRAFAAEAHATPSGLIRLPRLVKLAVPPWVRELYVSHWRWLFGEVVSSAIALPATRQQVRPPG